MTYETKVLTPTHLSLKSHPHCFGNGSLKDISTMKKLIASAGLVAVGATSLQAAYAPGLSPLETAKPWSISATVRGFYDDNYPTAPASFTGKTSSFGFEFSPSAAINIPMDQTYFGASYIYTMKYYESRPNDNFDQSH